MAAVINQRILDGALIGEDLLQFLAADVGADTQAISSLKDSVAQEDELAVNFVFSYNKRDLIDCLDGRYRQLIGRVGGRFPKSISPIKVDRMLSPSGRDSFSRRRSSAILEFLYVTGARLEEIVAVNDSQLDRDRANPSAVLGEAKRCVPLNDQTLSALASYVGSRRKLSTLSNSEATFVNEDGSRMSVEDVMAIIRQRARIAEIDDVHPLILRHSFAVHMCMGGMPLLNIQEILGQRDISNTAFYIACVDYRL